MNAPIVVATPSARYDVHVGSGVLGRLDELVPVPPHARRAALVTNRAVQVLYGTAVTAALERCGLTVDPVVIPDGEDAKSLSTVEVCYHRFAAGRLGRDDLVVALGGGVVGDLAGFAAATWNRGVAVLQLPTTLLAQVDAAIGGKTGVNLPEGKNLVGAFHQPLAVVADVGTLTTVPVHERRAGLGEVVKCGFVADPGILDLLEADPEAAIAGRLEVLEELVRRCVAVKARIVSADERETGERALLNYGHTVGHAIESLTGYGSYRHGEAVALGMVFAARLGERLGVTEAGLADRTVTLLNVLGLPTGGVLLEPAALWEHLARDKKARDGVRFVLCTKPGEALVVDPPERRIVDEILRSLA
jgi:3-dehydroquinate synthase